ncbi:MAG: Gfo/Idh/MocA family oxidoreductase [Caldilineaceae bacterium]
MITLGQLGCGYWGPNLLRNFLAQPQCRVKWVADSSAERRSFIQSTFPTATPIPEIETILEDREVDGVVIATPAASHHALAKEALRRGKHVFVEKPLAMTSAEADELATLAGERQRILFAGHTFLYNPAVRYLKKLIDQQDLGDIYYITCQRLNLGQVRNDVNAWWNLAPHDVSILLYLMNGELPISVAAQGMDYLQNGTEDVVFATLTWANRVAAHIHVSWLDPGKVRRMTIVGSRKMVLYDDVSDDKLTIYDKGFDRVPRIGERMDFDTPGGFLLKPRAGDILLPRIDWVEPLRVEAAHFLECIRTGATPLTGPKHGRDVVAVLEAGQQALIRGEITTISR